MSDFQDRDPVHQVVFRWDGNHGRQGTGMNAVAHSCTPERAAELGRELGPLLWMSGAAARPSVVRTVSSDEHVMLVQRWPTTDPGGRPSTVSHVLVGPPGTLKTRQCLGLAHGGWSTREQAERASGHKSVVDAAELNDLAIARLPDMLGGLPEVRHALTQITAELLRDPTQRVSLLLEERTPIAWPDRAAVPLVYLGLFLLFGSWLGHEWTFATYDTTDTHPLRLTAVPRWETDTGGSGPLARVMGRRPEDLHFGREAAQLVKYLLDHPDGLPGVPHLVDDLPDGRSLDWPLRRAHLRDILDSRPVAPRPATRSSLLGGERPEETDRPRRAEWPEGFERPEHPEHPRHPEHPERPERSDRPVAPARLDPRERDAPTEGNARDAWDARDAGDDRDARGARGDRGVWASGTERDPRDGTVGEADRPAPVLPATPTAPAGPAAGPDRFGRSGPSAPAARTGQPAPADRSGRPAGPDHPDRPRPDHPERPDHLDPSGHLGHPGHPGRPDRTGWVGGRAPAVLPGQAGPGPAGSGAAGHPGSAPPPPSSPPSPPPPTRPPGQTAAGHLEVHPPAPYHPTYPPGPAPAPAPASAATRTPVPGDGPTPGGTGVPAAAGASDLSRALRDRRPGDRQWRRTLASALSEQPDEFLLAELRSAELSEESLDLVLNELGRSERVRQRRGDMHHELCVELLHNDLYFTPQSSSGEHPSSTGAAERAAVLFQWAVAPLARDERYLLDLQELMHRVNRAPHPAAGNWLRRTVLEPVNGQIPDLPPTVWSQILRDVISRSKRPSTSPPTPLQEDPPDAQPPVNKAIWVIGGAVCAVLAFIVLVVTWAYS
ncbi:hypothetical protein ACIGZH_31985 [Streptomyces sp. NPDC058319]|uniref:hypothetical protein n=1 Tax=unclassified Streptomyces TaxID=2593676 RepID=UPI0036ED1ADC